MPDGLNSLQPMFPALRRSQIMKLVQDRGSINISELTEIFGVSEMTIHRDLAKLQEVGTLEKTYGGVIAKSFMVLEPDFLARSRAFIAEKEAIGREAALLVNDGDSIFLDAGTTCLALARHLKNKRNINIFTTGIYQQVEFASNESATVFSTGGILSNRTSSYVGPHTVEFLSHIHIDKCFIGANSVDVVHGVTDPYPLEAEVKRCAAAAADRVVLLVDCTKFGKVSIFKSMDLSRVHLIITDRSCPSPYLEEIEKAGIHYILAPASTD